MQNNCFNCKFYKPSRFARFLDRCLHTFTAKYVSTENTYFMNPCGKEKKLFVKKTTSFDEDIKQELDNLGL